MKKTLLSALVLSLLLFAKERDALLLSKPKINRKPAGENSVLGKPILGAQKKMGDPNEEAALKPYVASLGVFGTDKLNEPLLRQFLGKDLDVWLEKGLKGDESSILLEDTLAKRVQDKFGFADVSWSVIQFFEENDLAIHITLDVVEKADVARRMPFLSPPKGEFMDPDGLIANWAQYESTALGLIEANKLTPDMEKCPAFHCPFGHKEERLKKYQAIFVEGVKKHGETLGKIISEDKRPDYRAAAAYLLAYHKEGKKVVDWMVGRIKDPDPLVRNNALRVLGDIAEFHPELVIPIKPIIEATEFPKASDRSKAVYVAFIVTLNSQSARDEIRKTAIPKMLALLSGKQPDAREFAHGILRKISGKEYPATDSAAWLAWYKKLPQQRGVSNKP